MKRGPIIRLAAIVLVAFGFLFIKSRLISSGTTYAPDGAAAERLAAEKPRREGGRTWLGAAWKERRPEGIIISMTGAPYEMGYQHGALLRDEIRRGVVPVFADPVTNSREHRAKPAFLRKLMLAYLDFAVFGPLERNTPAEYLMELKGIADGSGLDYRDLIRATFKSELTMIMVPGVVKAKAKTLGISAECSDFAAAGVATADGKLIMGRNTDYAGQGRWMDAQTVFIYHPRRGHAYVNISTAGLVKCNSAVNEKGIVIGGHFMGFDGTGPRGLSFTVLEHEIMRTASTIDEAVDIVKRGPRAGAFGFMVADGARRDAVAIEANGESVGLKRMENGVLVLTNFATTAELEKVDLMKRYNLVMRDMFGRYLRLGELIAAGRGRITGAMAASFMGDRIDMVTRTERATGITVGAANNVTSAVFIPEDGIVWISSGVEPACDGRYHGLDVRAELAGTAARRLPVLSGYVWKEDSKQKGLRHFMKAYAAHEEDPFDTKKIMAHLDAAIALDPKETIYLRLKASLLLHAGAYKEAVVLLEKSLDRPQSNSERAHALLLAGQGLDLMGERDKAIARYRMAEALHAAHGPDILKGVNRMLAGFCNKYIEKPFTAKQIADIPVAFNSESGIE
ncbi:MAG: C45 family autoproteolytic acyltransferase/hydrolase [Spirochaetes bacterium]|nr:C45 family autoproteolytic acyltransferase/hydrolase [Spirochaetota bacterium]